MVFQAQRVGKFNPPADSRKILLLEDDEVQRKVIIKMLKPFICDVIEASSPSEAWSFIESVQIDMAIVDLLLPGDDGNGAAFVEKLRAGSNTKDMPILMISGSPNSNAVQTARRLNCLEFLRKPVDQSRLVEIFRNTGLLRMAPSEQKENLGTKDFDALSPAFRIPCNVVLFDRDPGNVKSFRAVLEKTRWSLEVCPHFSAAEHFLEGKDADLIFVNINQEESSEAAIDICAKLMNDASLEGARVVAISVHSDSEGLLLAEEKGIRRFMLDKVTDKKLSDIGGFLLERSGG